ncbi:hypothetical protein NU09_2948 [Flavobacterium beibuense]|uniref:Uncharacterized protein n=1 Tax=Flavobacterium beibuense TaxID=657326 RepID=A0A444W6U8_9FLAO|nr:hypothetical protein NU09_2948 [Flavobacterium beibuense]
MKGINNFIVLSTYRGRVVTNLKLNGINNKKGLQKCKPFNLSTN